MENIDQCIGGCLPRIRSIAQVLTKAEQKVAEYILEYPAEVVHLSINELAKITGSAEATIFRLCQKLGFKGYQSLKIALAGDLYTPMESAYNEVNPKDSIATITAKVFQSINEGLHDTLKIINEKAFDQAINTIVAARRIDAYGSGGSAIIANDIEHRFMRLGIPVRAYSDPHMQISSSALMESGDLVIAISHTGTNRDLLDSVNVAKESGATVIAITSHMKSPICKVADISLYGTAKETEYRSEAMAARLIHFAIVDVLYVGVIIRQHERFVKNMQKIHQAIDVRRI